MEAMDVGKRKAMLNFFGPLIVLTGLLYVLLCIYLFLLQSRLLYYPNLGGRKLQASPADIGLEYESVTLVSSDSVRIHGFFVQLFVALFGIGAGTATLHLFVYIDHAFAGQVAVPVNAESLEHLAEPELLKLLRQCPPVLHAGTGIEDNSNWQQHGKDEQQQSKQDD